ncbi:MAG: hypothetical protein ACXW2S_03620 [Telluria sp.]
MSNKKVTILNIFRPVIVPDPCLSPAIGNPVRFVVESPRVAAGLRCTVLMWIKLAQCPARVSGPK